MSHAPPRRGAAREPTEFIGGSPAAKGPAEQTSLLATVRGEAYLVVSSGPQREAEIPLRGDEIAIGRDPQADVPIEEPSASRRHALIVRRRDGFYLRDLGSTNGTYHVRLLRGEEKRLMDGDRFRIGRTEFAFYEAAPQTLEESS